MIPLLERIKDSKPLIYDGGFGSQLFARGIELANSCVANELYPKAVVGVHSDYINAGADAIGTVVNVPDSPVNSVSNLFSKPARPECSVPTNPTNAPAISPCG